MIEKIVLDYLLSTIPTDVFMEYQEDMPGEYVIIEKTGSSETNHIYSATMAIQSYADSLYQAAQLNELVKEAMDNIITLDSIVSSDLNSDYNYTDTTRKKYRYQAVYDLTHY